MTKRKEFQSVSFRINETVMDMKEESNGPFYPVSDRCNRTKDPASGCIFASSLFFRTPILFASDSYSFVVHNDRNESFFADRIPRVYHRIETRFSLQCTTMTECEDMCRQKGGLWSNRDGECNITLYLHRACYRVQNHFGHISLDTSELVDPKAYGCYYSHEWSPFLFSPSPPTTPIFLFVGFLGRVHRRFD